MKVLQKKICMLGSFSVGKTSLVRQFIEGQFTDKYLSTIGVKVSRKTIERPNHQLNFLVWDLAGGDDFSKSGSSYLRGAKGALIVCDLTRIDTLVEFKNYTHQLHQISPEAPIIYLANKVDLVQAREISKEELQETCRQLGGSFLLTSAKTGENVENAFHQLADLLEGITL